MTDQTTSTSVSVQRPPNDETSRVPRPADRRKQLVEMEYQLRAMELHLAVAEEELKSLAGFSLTRILASLKGNLNARLEEARCQVRDLQSQYDAAAQELDHLARQVEELERSVVPEREVQISGEHASVGRADGARAASQTEENKSSHSTPRQGLKTIQRALDAAQEARKGLLAEMETASTLGRCKVTDGHKLLKALRGAAGKHVLAESASRVRGDIRRLAGRFTEAVAAGPTAASPEEMEMQPVLERLGREFSGAWLTSNQAGDESADGVLQTLSLAEMLLERRLNDAKKHSDASIET